MRMLCLWLAWDAGPWPWSWSRQGLVLDLSLTLHFSFLVISIRFLALATDGAPEANGIATDSRRLFDWPPLLQRGFFELITLGIVACAVFLFLCTVHGFFAALGVFIGLLPTFSYDSLPRSDMVSGRSGAVLCILFGVFGFYFNELNPSVP